MESKGIKKYDLRQIGISPTIVNKLIKNESVNITTIVKICEILECQPGDILECIDSDGFEQLVPTMKGAKVLEKIRKSTRK